MCVYSLNKFFFTAIKKDRFEQTVDGNQELLEESVPLNVSMNVNSPFPVYSKRDSRLWNRFAQQIIPFQNNTVCLHLSLPLTS